MIIYFTATPKLKEPAPSIGSKILLDDGNTVYSSIKEAFSGAIDYAEKPFYICKAEIEDKIIIDSINGNLCHSKMDVPVFIEEVTTVE